MIVKVQKPLSGTGVELDLQWLIYARGHQHMSLVRPEDIPDDVKAAMAADFKAYFEAELTEGHWKIGARVGAQAW